MRNSSVRCFESAQIPGTAGIEKIDERFLKIRNRSSACEGVRFQVKTAPV
jgi:hypothetical protein